MLVVDDQVLVRAGFRMILEAETDVVVAGEAGDGEAALQVAAECAPDLVLMDVRMPGMDGIAATAAILGEFPSARVIVLSGDATGEERSLRAGAKAFLLKETPGAELLSVIHSLCQAGLSLCLVALAWEPTGLLAAIT